MLSMHILLPKQSNFKTLGQFENLGFLIMSTRENTRLIARTSFVVVDVQLSPCFLSDNIYRSRQRIMSNQ